MGDVTQLLQKWREGSREAEDELFTLVLPNLRRLAHYLMKGERQGHSLQPTELVEQTRPRPPGPARSGAHGGRASGAVPVVPVALGEVTAHEHERLSTGISELYNVLGGGIVPGS